MGYCHCDTAMESATARHAARNRGVDALQRDPECSRSFHTMINGKVNMESAALACPASQQAWFEEYWRKAGGSPIAARDLILTSFCPSVWGMYMVKLALMLTVSLLLMHANVFSLLAAFQKSKVACTCEETRTCYWSEIQAPQRANCYASPPLCLLAQSSLPGSAARTLASHALQ
jgi:hypothetical protein